MPLRTINLTISANVVAAYAEIVSTITGTIQFLNYLRECTGTFRFPARSSAPRFPSYPL
jgi:hypothetical protein